MSETKTQLSHYELLDGISGPMLYGDVKESGITKFLGLIWFAVVFFVIGLLIISDVLIIFVLLAIIAIPMSYMVYRYYKNRAEAKKKMLNRFDQFFIQNGFTPEPVFSTASDGDTPFLFEVGDSKANIHAFSKEVDGYKLTHFIYKYSTGSGRSRKTHYVSSVHFNLPKKLPHIVLDSRKNDGFFSSIPVYIVDEQRIELEGDFNKDFDLFAPKEYEVEALDIMSPDFMRGLQVYSTPFDIELDGQNVYIISTDWLANEKQLKELFDASFKLIEWLKFKMQSWQFQEIPSNAPELMYQKTGGSTFRIGNKRISGAVITVPLVILYVWAKAEIAIDWRIVVSAVFVGAGLAFLWSKYGLKKSK